MKLRLPACSLLLLCFTFLAASAAIAKKTPPSTPLDLNTATAPQLAQLPGIGPATAKAIVQFRQKSGPFKRVEDLLAIRGISTRKLAQIRPYVIIAKPAPRKPSSSRGSGIVRAAPESVAATFWGSPIDFSVAPGFSLPAVIPRKFALMSS